MQSYTNCLVYLDISQRNLSKFEEQLFDKLFVIISDFVGEKEREKEREGGRERKTMCTLKQPYCHGTSSFNCKQC